LLVIAPHRASNRDGAPTSAALFRLARTLGRRPSLAPTGRLRNLAKQWAAIHRAGLRKPAPDD